MRVGDEGGRRAEAAVRAAGDDQVLVRADGLGVGRDVVGQSGTRFEELADPDVERTAQLAQGPASNDSTTTGASRAFSPAASSAATSGGPNGRPSAANRLGSFSSR